MKLKSTLLSLCLFASTAVLSADLYTLIPFKEYADCRTKVFGFFDTLYSYGAYLIGDDGQYLGNISRSRYSFDSLNNDWGSYGSNYSKHSIFNTTSSYGSELSDLSPFNTYALRPPTIRYKQNGVEYIAGYLTRNAYFMGSYAIPNIDPSSLWDWLKACDRCR